jgi:BirA family biotin operon repressor/biotin-[acetyl-CoA-carboxylase] ligase
MHNSCTDLIRLLRAGGGYVSGQQIAGRLGITRAAVWKQVENLRSDGFLVESSTNRGYRLAGVPDIPSQEVLSSILNTSVFGKVIEYHEEIQSTNDRAMELGRENAPEGTVITADAQTAGKAKFGGSWESPSGKNLYLSVLLYPGVSADRCFEIERLALESLSSAVTSMYPELPLTLLESGLFSDKSKIGGVLCELSGEIGRVDYLVAGIGLNVTHHSTSPRHESISSLTGKTPSRAELTASVLEFFERSYRKWEKNEKS